LGWRRTTPHYLGIRLTDPADLDAWTAIDRVAADVGGDRLVVLIEPAPDTRVSRRTTRRIEREHGLTVEVLEQDQARSGQLQGLRAILHPSEVAADATWLAEVAARRLPIVPMPTRPDDHVASATANAPEGAHASGEHDTPGIARDSGDAGDPDSTPTGLPEVDGLIAQTTLATVDDEHARELIGVRLRRAILEAVSTCPASVSVVMATNRPDRLPEALRQIEAQTHTALETVFAIHGALPSQLRTELETAATRPTTIIEVEATASLGEVLNRAVAASSADIITKMDDDDLYAPEHIADLLDALSYSGAHLVGKGSEFVYLAEIDTTIRRFPNGVETANRNLAGGTLMIARHDLEDAGGWRDIPRAVDQALIDDVEAAGGTFHRTHALGFVLNRHGTAHTWDASIDYFLQQAVAQWPGLALEAAGWPKTSATLQGR